jgi:hypothetical protein
MGRGSKELRVDDAIIRAGRIGDRGWGFGHNLQRVEIRGGEIWCGKG